MDKTNLDNLSERERAVVTRQILIDGMTCDECVRTIERALKSVDGVEEILVDRKNRRATVTFDSRKTDIPELHDALLEHGYTPSPAAENR